MSKQHVARGSGLARTCRAPIGIERHYSVNQACEITGYGRTWIYRLMQTGDLRWVRVGKRRRIPASSLSALLAPEDDQ